VRSALAESPPQETQEPLDPPQESKALRLARYLKEFVGLRSTTIRDVDKYEAVLWFADMPQVSDCQSSAWNDTFEPGAPWLEVRKQRFPKPPDPPGMILPWIDQQALRRATPEMPQLRSSILLPDVTVEVGTDEEPPLVESPLTDHPEISSAYARYRPSWEAWSAEYRRREYVQTIYAELFNLHTQVLKQGEIVELVLGLGFLDWRNPGKGQAASIRRHLVSARVDLHFDAVTGTMRLDGAADGAQLRIEDDMLEAEMRPERGQYDSVSTLLGAIGDDVWDHANMHRALRSWAEALHPDSQWSASLKPDTGSEAKPIISFAPALILRKRNQVGMVRIYDALIDRLSANVDEAPLGWRGLVDDEDDRDESETLTPFDERNGQARLDVQEIYFPLPANRQQKQIVEAIARRRGVLVQGPPGTGKSHTIANLMCHLLATGKRVLITAETGRALQVLKDKLPPEIQPLCVSLLGQGGDAFAELNSAVQGITTRHATYNEGDDKGRIAEIDGELDSTRRSLATIDTELRSLREGETCPHTIANGAYQGTASAIAERVANESEDFRWLRIPQDAADLPPLSDAELTEWLRILRSYSNDVIDSSKRKILASENLPTPAEFGVAVSAEREANAVVERIAALRRHPAYGPILALGANGRSKLGEHLRLQDERRQKLSRFGLDWVNDALSEALTGRHAVWHALRERTNGLIGHIEGLLSSLGSTSVSVNVTKHAKAVRADASAIIQHLEAGGKWKKLAFFTPEVVKERTYLLDQVSVDGQPADTIERLQAVCKHLDLTVAIEDVQHAWTDHGGLPSGSDLRMRVAAIKEQVGVLTDALHYADACIKLGSAMKSAASSIPEPDWQSNDVQDWLRMIDAAAQEERKRQAADQVTKCLRELGVMRDMFDAHPLVGAMIDAVEQRNVTAYSQIYADVQGIEQTRRDQLRRAQIETVLTAAVPGFIGAVTDSSSNEAWDKRFRNWTQSWNWALADNWLQKRSDREYQQRLWERRLDTDKAIGQLLSESAALRAWSHFFARLSTKESAALKSWREAVRAMGKGTGKSAKMERLRREARQYMDQCREAIPVWIMPRYLVAEMIEPAPGRYDVVIVDEASQLGVESLFLFYIAKKMVVVGDDQQISPYGVGIADEAIAGLQHHYLDGVPHHHALSAQSSLYGNAKIRFGQNIVLREHFRCMPEIIQFSNDLCYASNGTPLDPLRSYPANRLKPLVARRVPDGYRKGGPQNALNEPEADALVAQIVACIADPRYAGRTMGVISLQGDSQAKLIEHKILERLEPEVISERRLICGDAYAFQGDERHIIFLSMVAAPNEKIGALAVDSARQRFNVAASRAQDQMWLFHSVDLDVLSLSCMRHRLLGYMLNPGRLATNEREQKFDSQFERDVFRAITQRNFHVRTQVCIGDPTNHRYRIDLVVEGMKGRLAVECDGDQWHGPERYDQDMARQRDLERAGWKFVRIRGGDFYRDRVKSLDVLWAELHRLGIEPGGIDEAAAEPPAPSDHIGTANIETDEIIAVALEAESIGETDNTIEPAGDPDGEAAALFRGEEPTALVTAPQSPNGMFAAYVAFDGPAGDDPRTLNVGEVAEGLCRIVDVEGPMIAKRAYDIYLRGCGIKRMGHELKSTMNKALANAIRRGRIVSEDELGTQGFLFSVIRIKESLPIKLRSRGPRAFEEIPPSELLVVARRLVEQHDFSPGSDEHLRAVLECFDLKRLTTSVGTTLLEVIEKKIDYVDDFLLNQVE
jgi:very-short-patch-repair endonuclease